MIDNVRLPVDIERGTRGGPTFRTTIVGLASGKESRNREWAIAKSEWNIGYGIQKRADMEAVYAFFMARAGMHRGFLFRNWFDYSAELEPVAAVTGEATKRQLVKVYPDTVNAYMRVIKHPIIDTLKVYVNSIMVTNYTVSMGELTFTADPGLDVVATFEYDIPVRFDTDSLEAQLNTFMEGNYPSINIVELIGE